MLAFLAARAVPGIERIDGVVYRRTFDIDGSTGIVEVAPTAGLDGLDVAFLAVDADVADGVGSRLHRLLGLDADVAAIAARLSRDPFLKPFVAARPALRVPGGWEGFEVAMRAVIGQQVSVAAARRLNGRLVERCGRDLPGQASWRLFPTPEAVLAADLSGMGMPGGRRTGACRPRPVRTRRGDRRNGDAPAFDPRYRRLDRALHRDARLPGARRLSRRRRGAASRHGGWRGNPAKTGGTARARRMLAALARLCRAAHLGGRCRARDGSRRAGTHHPGSPLQRADRIGDVPRASRGAIHPPSAMAGVRRSAMPAARETGPGRGDRHEDS